MATNGTPELRLVFPIEDPKVRQIEIRTPLLRFWGAYRAIHQGGLDESLALVVFGSSVYGAIRDRGVADPERTFAKVWRWMGDHYELGINRWETETDLVMSFCYFLLRHKLITRAEAAQFAREALNEPIDQESWRKRIDRWANRHKLPALGQTKRPPRK